MPDLSLKALRSQAITQSLFRPTTLKRAITRMGFVQADPIRAPARAQDLVLRHRVNGYKAGDLEKKYPALGLEEDFLYAYGFMPLAAWQLLHPVNKSRLSAAEKRVIDVVSHHKQVHPRELEAYLGAKREFNDWGGYSKVTTRILQRLHRRGILRVARREKGIRLYEVSSAECEPLDQTERLHRIILLIARLLAPLSERSLRETCSLARRTADGLRAGVAALLKSGQLASAHVDDVRYVWPAGWSLEPKVEHEKVRFLAPFDPIVWDRRRFEHFWGWRYRFEAYTPLPKRKLGYYAMPILWREEMIGWVNLAVEAGELTTQIGYVNGQPSGSRFRQECENEIARVQTFLHLPTSRVLEDESSER